MDNIDVIDALKEAIALLRRRLAELEALKANIGGPLHERLDRFNRIVSRMDMLLRDIRLLELQVIQRETARALGEAVTPLSPARKEALEAGLHELNQSIVATMAFKDALKLATTISDVADDVAAAGAIA